MFLPRVCSASIVVLAACGNPPAPPFDPGPPPTTVTPVLPPPDLSIVPGHVDDDDDDSDVPLPDDAHLCARPSDCVLLTDECGNVVSANRDSASALQAANRELASVARCAPHDIPLVDPTCVDHTCTTMPAVDADARSCAHDDTCEAVQITCHWLVASTSAPGYPRIQELARIASGGPPVPCPLPPEPDVVCRNALCSFTSSLVPTEE